jgi:hypothetical protein
MKTEQIKRWLSRKQEMHQQTIVSKACIVKLEAELEFRKQLLMLEELQLKNFKDNYLS